MFQRFTDVERVRKGRGRAQALVASARLLGRGARAQRNGAPARAAHEVCRGNGEGEAAPLRRETLPDLAVFLARLVLQADLLSAVWTKTFVISGSAENPWRDLRNVNTAQIFSTMVPTAALF